MVEQPERGLLTDATADWRRDELPKENLPALSFVPPSDDDLESRGQIRQDWSAFGPTERDTAERLRELGIEVVSVDAMGGRYGSTPDAAILEKRMTLEIKRTNTPRHGGIQGAVDRAIEQSRHLVIDARQSRIHEHDAVTAVAVALRRLGRAFDEVLVLGEGFGILRP